MVQSQQEDEDSKKYFQNQINKLVQEKSLLQKEIDGVNIDTTVIKSRKHKRGFKDVVKKVQIQSEYRERYGVKDGSSAPSPTTSPTILGKRKSSYDLSLQPDIEAEKEEEGEGEKSGGLGWRMVGKLFGK